MTCDTSCRGAHRNPHRGTHVAPRAIPEEGHHDDHGQSAARRRLAVPWPAGGLRQFRGEAGRGTATAAGDGRQAGGQGDHRVGRLHRPLRRDRPRSRCAPASTAISNRSTSPTARSSRRATCCSSSTSARIEAALTQAEAALVVGARRGSNSREQELERAEQPGAHRHRAGALARPAPPAVPVRPGRRRRRQGALAAGAPRSRIHRGARADHRPHQPQAGHRGQPRQRQRRRCSPRSCRSTRSTSISTSTSDRYIAYSRMGRDGTRPSRPRHATSRSVVLLERRARGDARGKHRLRRQPGRPGHRHDARPRRVREQGPAADARHVRPRAHPGQRPLHGRAHPGRGDRHRPGAAASSMSSARDGTVSTKADAAGPAHRRLPRRAQRPDRRRDDHRQRPACASRPGAKVHAAA